MALGQGKSDPLRYRVRFLILTLLAIKPSHGYELSKKIEDLTRGLVKGSPGSIYPVLKELKDEGYLEEDLVVEQGRAKKIYRLTPKGARVLASELDIFYDIANVLIELAVKAKKRLEEIAGDASGLRPYEACPDPETIERLDNLKHMIEDYLETLRERLRECGRA